MLFHSVRPIDIHNPPVNKKALWRTTLQLLFSLSLWWLVLRNQRNVGYQHNVNHTVISGKYKAEISSVFAPLWPDPCTQSDGSVQVLEVKNVNLFLDRNKMGAAKKIHTRNATQGTLDIVFATGFKKDLTLQQITSEHREE